MGKVKTGYIKDYGNPPKNDPNDAQFIVCFRETSSYNGGFGIDYMSGEPSKLKGSSEIKYRNEIESGNWADFEKLYNPTKIYNNDYYTPWASMYKDNHIVTGEQVKLTLYVKKVSGNWDNTTTDEIKFPAKDGLRFVPETFNAKTADSQEITVYCDNELPSHYLYEVKDQNGNVVGTINFYENSLNHQRMLNVKLIRVSFDGTFVSINQSNINDWLNEQGLNQAMIQCNFTQEDYDVSLSPHINSNIISDIQSFPIADSANPNLIISRGRFYYQLFQDYDNKNPNDTSDLRYFFVNLEARGASGVGSFANGEAVSGREKDIVIFTKGNSNGNTKGTIIHEGLHVLGLQHFFMNTTGGNGEFYFKRWQTDNIMDYYNSPYTVINEPDERKRIIKWQWDLTR